MTYSGKRPKTAKQLRADIAAKVSIVKDLDLFDKVERITTVLGKEIDHNVKIFRYYMGSCNPIEFKISGGVAEIKFNNEVVFGAFLKSNASDNVFPEQCYTNKLGLTILVTDYIAGPWEQWVSLNKIQETEQKKEKAAAQEKERVQKEIEENRSPNTQEIAHARRFGINY